jgi:hypothetical protein
VVIESVPLNERRTVEALVQEMERLLAAPVDLRRDGRASSPDVEATICPSDAAPRSTNNVAPPTNRDSPPNILPPARK